MRYLVAYLIEGEAGRWHTSLADDLAERLGTWKVTERIPSHVTLFRPFETDDISPIEKEIEAWGDGRGVPGTFIMEGYGYFDDRVAYAAIGADPGVREAASALRTRLEALGLPREDERSWVPHATLLHRVDPETVEAARRYLETLPALRFELPFNNVALLIWREEGGFWESVRMMRLE